MYLSRRFVWGSGRHVSQEVLSNTPCSNLRISRFATLQLNPVTFRGAFATPVAYTSTNVSTTWSSPFPRQLSSPETFRLKCCRQSQHVLDLTPIRKHSRKLHHHQQPQDSHVFCGHCTTSQTTFADRCKKPHPGLS